MKLPLKLKYFMINVGDLKLAVLAMRFLSEPGIKDQYAIRLLQRVVEQWSDNMDIAPLCISVMMRSNIIRIITIGEGERTSAIYAVSTDGSVPKYKEAGVWALQPDAMNEGCCELPGAWDYGPVDLAIAFQAMLMLGALFREVIQKHPLAKNQEWSLEVEDAIHQAQYWWSYT